MLPAMWQEGKSLCQRTKGYINSPACGWKCLTVDGGSNAVGRFTDRPGEVDIDLLF